MVVSAVVRKQYIFLCNVINCMGRKIMLAIRKRKSIETRGKMLNITLRDL